MNNNILPRRVYPVDTSNMSREQAEDFLQKLIKVHRLKTLWNNYCIKKGLRSEPEEQYWYEHLQIPYYDDGAEYNTALPGGFIIK